LINHVVQHFDKFWANLDRVDLKHFSKSGRLAWNDPLERHPCKPASKKNLVVLVLSNSPWLLKNLKKCPKWNY